MLRRYLLSCFALIVVLSAISVLASKPARAISIDQPVVLELFTSQGCSSCPPADALVKKLAASDPSLVILSYHVHYWDNLGWKDPFSSPLFTDRQKNYAANLHLKNIFTPQIVVNGTSSVIGSHTSDVLEAINEARHHLNLFDVRLDPDKEHQSLTIVLSPHTSSPELVNADVFEIHFKRDTRVDVAAGENGGQNLENINSVISARRLGNWTRSTPNFQVPLTAKPDEGIAIIVQAPEQGPILGAALYNAQPVDDSKL